MSGADQKQIDPETVVYVVGQGDVDIWGMTSAERLRRSFARIGVDAVKASGTGDVLDGASMIAIRADWVFDQRLIEALARRADAALVPEHGTAPVALHTTDAGAVRRFATGQGVEAAGLTAMTPTELAGNYNNKLRKREAPFLVPLNPQTLPEIHDRTFQASYKGVTDFITKHVWPPPAKAVTRWCARRGVTPNQVTWTSFVCVLLAFWLFWIGSFALGLVAAWLMTFLDTVDGKLARVTMTYSKAGDVLDHGIDLIHPPFWWWAWIVGLGAAGHVLAYPGLILAVVVGGYVAQRIEEGVFLQLFGIEMHIWRPFDSWFRGITARRNPNLLILTIATLVGRPDWGMVAVAIWTGACFLVHLAQIVQAFAASRSRPIVSWLAA